MVAYFCVKTLDVPFPEKEEALSSPQAVEWVPFQPPVPAAHSVFRSGPSSWNSNQPTLYDRFQLTGTFEWKNPSSGIDVRHVVINDLLGKTQHMVEEGGAVSGLVILAVSHDEARVRWDGLERILRLELSDPLAGTQLDKGELTPEGKDVIPWDERVLESNRFGVRIAENR